MKYGVFYHHIRCAADEERCTMDQMLDRVRSWGITYVELDRDDLGTTESGLRAFAAMLAGHDLLAGSIYGFYDWENGCDNITGDDLLIRQARILDCPRVMVIPGFFTEPGDHHRCKLELDRMKEGMRRFVTCASEQALTVTMEDFDDARSPIGTMEGMQGFLDENPDLYVTLDTGNFFFQEEDVLEAQQRFRDRIRHVHLKDRFLPVRENGDIPAHLSGGEPKNTVFDTVMMPCAVGQGHIPVGEVLDRLRMADYQGMMTIEHFGVPSYAAAIRDSVSWLKNRESSL